MKMMAHHHFLCHFYCSFSVVFSHNFIRQDKTFLKKSDDLF